MLHLEAATCASGADEEYVTEVANECYQSHRYTTDNPDFNFACPTCKTLFMLMSGLLQHAESDYCDERVERHTSLGQMLHYLRLRLRKW